VDAAFQAIDQVVDVPNELLEYSVQAMTEGVDALAKVTVRIESELRIGRTQKAEKRVFLGRGADTDIIVASAKAYLFALNRHLAAQETSRKRRAVAREVQQVVEEMSARFGTGHTSDLMGWTVLRGEDLI
jgi:2-isopropylmalate synthase